MALLENTWKGWGPEILIGVGVVLAVPILLPVVAATVRPLAKALIKGYFALADVVKEVAEEATRENAVEIIEDIAVEAGEALIESAG
jgi:hypothetical protein